MNYLQDLWRLVRTAPQQALDPQMQIFIHEDFIEKLGLKPRPFRATFRV